MATFVDTHFVVALVSPRDRHHAEALELAKAYLGTSLLTTNIVLVEIGDGLARGFRAEAVEIIRQFQEAAGIEIVHLTPDLFAEAFDLYTTRADKTWGLTDCVSFVVMEHRGIRDALTYDQHFVQAGFDALMRPT